MPVICKSCGSDVSKTWWKCCPKHTTEQGIDVVCQACANICLNGKEVVSVTNPYPIDFPCRVDERTAVRHCSSCEMVPELLNKIEGLELALIQANNPNIDMSTVRHSRSNNER